ncbi:hypothetical protein EPR50_G00029700 [Perca flavescens]|uniref:Protein-tyrosine sulfotransferase n=1 Tax=Perca flavescens TaxID=8167 RepID=A0A484DLB8_PERFV|nr:hypothetical protein EPR50_G00029700 [Perca flavescens]
MIGKLKQNLLLACLVISSVTVFYLGRHAMECHHRIEERSQLGGILPLSALGGSMRTTLRTGQNLSTPFVYNKDMPLIFIGGVPRSGTTLMRAMLDAHPEVRCGEETRVIPRILAMKQMWSRSGREKMRLDEAGVTDEVLDAAMQAFLLEIIVKHGEPANFLCNKDPFALKSLSYLAKIFPHAKFVLMIRDGRASVHSMISRKVTIAGFDLGSYRDCLTKWNRAIETMYTQCLEAADKCLPMHYEQLVLHPEKWMKTLLKFLDVPWNDAVLHHEELIGKAGGVSLSKVERSTDQVIKPVNVEALSKWVGKIPADVVRDMAVIAPMLSRLGYDPHANPPNYGRPDPKVLDNTIRVFKDSEVCRETPPQLGAAGVPSPQHTGTEVQWNRNTLTLSHPSRRLCWAATLFKGPMTTAGPSPHQSQPPLAFDVVLYNKMILILLTTTECLLICYFSVSHHAHRFVLEMISGYLEYNSVILL